MLELRPGFAKLSLAFKLLFRLYVSLICKQGKFCAIHVDWSIDEIYAGAAINVKYQSAYQDKLSTLL